MPRHSPDVLTFAKRGAQARVQELLSEIRAIKNAFRHLRYGSAVSPSMPDAADEGKPPRERHRISAAGRRRIAEAQHRRWAKVRKAASARKKKGG